MQPTARVFVALLTILLPSALVSADLTAKPDAYTENDHYRDLLEFNRKTLTDAYKQIGHKNPAWDTDAIKFLDLAATHFSSVGARAVEKPMPPSFKDLLEAGETVAKKGCDDAIVLYCYGVFLAEGGRPDDGKPVLQQAYKGLIQSKYPPERIYYAGRRQLKETQTLKDRLEITAEMEKARAKMLTTKWVNSAHRRMVADAICEEITSAATKKQLDFYEQNAKNKQADQWIVNLYGGRYFVQAAWASRGNAWANQVKPQGWRGFEANLEKAAECLNVAWRLAPNLPEAPAEMITVAMGQGHRGQNELRLWFDRAIAAQFDYHDAYGKLVYALMPRWLGSHEEMLAVGIECFRTGRYDTRVPYELINCLNKIRDDRNGDMSLWDKPEIYEMVRDLMVAYAAKSKGKSEESYRWYLSYAAALANRQNKHEESRKFLEQIDDKIVESTYKQLHLTPNLSVSESYLLTGPFADRFKEAFELQKAEKHDQAAPAFQKILDELPKNDKGLLIAQDHLRRSDDVLKLASGEWVDLSPRTDLSPWGTYFGVWSSPKDGELLAIADQRGLMALPTLTMPPRYEFTAECEIRRTGEVKNPHAGLIINFSGWQEPYPGVWVYPSDKKLFTRGKEDKWHDIECADKFKLTVQVIDDVATVVLDGKQVAQFPGVARPNAKHTGIGLTGMHDLPEAGVVFREVKVRKLKKDPAAPAPNDP